MPRCLLVLVSLAAIGCRAPGSPATAGPGPARDLVLSALEVDASSAPRRRPDAHPRLGDVSDDALFGPDRLARSGGTPRVEAFEGRRIIEEGATRIEAIDIGAASDHTDEYVVFYLPRQRLLFQGDLGWSATPDGGIRAGRRAAGLHRAIVDRHLDVQTLVQGWPVAGQPRSVSIAELRCALSER